MRKSYVRASRTFQKKVKLQSKLNSLGRLPYPNPKTTWAAYRVVG